MRQVALSALMVLALAAQTAPPTPRPKPTIPVDGLTQIFSSGFEPPISFVPVGNNGGELKGGEWDAFPHYFNFAAYDAIAKGYVKVEFDTTKKVDGIRSLLMMSRDTAGTPIPQPQNRLQIYCNDTTKTADNVHVATELYIERYLWLPDLLTLYSPTTVSGLAISGIREYGEYGEYSSNIQLVRDSKTVYLRVAFMDYTNGASWSERTGAPTGPYPKVGGSIHSNMTFPIPLQKWFKFGTYFKRGENDGRVAIWIDDKVVLDLTNVRTSRGNSPQYFAKLADNDGEGATLWVDELSVWKR
jgi:hypothetical protein